MPHGNFVWADLSSFRPTVTRQFYSDLFGWRFDDYSASTASGPVAGLYEMPEKFQAINMPSFWMSYISVDDVGKTVEVARANGAKVELGPIPFEGGGQIALIRDPLGAGFTIYEGSSLNSSASGEGAKLGHGLFVSDASAVIGFYETLFGWRFKPMADGAQEIQANGRRIAHLYEIPDPAIRGKEQYWAVYFGAQNLDEAQLKVTASGGEVVGETEILEGRAIVAKDPDGGTFWMLETTSDAAKNTVVSPARPFKWKAWLGLLLVIASALTESTWPWVIFLGIWTWVGLKERTTYLFEAITSKDDPLLYWLVITIYGVLTILAILYV
ncbi:MAG: VOC family protein [Paracoccaceae bacterium]|nr:VOC family protein [Paracoccaceae bacterium]MDG1738529.1 VOC family protein [Paracoccaceae bacterium]MDG2260217.1 VOC family protein [Paracoccaceae bacterium]